MKNNILQLHNQSERTVEKIDCPFSMPMSRKERPPMTKPREKTREELQAEIEGGKDVASEDTQRGTQNAQPPPYRPGRGL